MSTEIPPRVAIEIADQADGSTIVRIVIRGVDVEIVRNQVTRIECGAVDLHFGGLYPQIAATVGSRDKDQDGSLFRYRAEVARRRAAKQARRRAKDKSNENAGKPAKPTTDNSNEIPV
jgi:hypothetical protein